MKQEIKQLLDWRMNTELAGLPTVCANTQRSGMRNVASSVSIITAGIGDKRVGLTVTAVCSVTVEPPRMLVLINKNSFANETILKEGALCINVLSSEQEDLARIFAGMVESVPGPARFEHGQWGTMISGAPILKGALSNFDCRVINVFDESTHHAVVCEVLGSTGVPDNDPLLYMRGAFRRLAPL